MKKYLIKIWETEELRDSGQSDIIEVDITSIKEAIAKAKKIMEEQQYASLEVQDNEEQQSIYFCTPIEERYYYNNFEEDSKEDKIKNTVELYFVEKGLQNLMDYGSDRDSIVMPTLSDLYKELMDKLNIKYFSVETDDVSDGKYETTIEFKNGSSIIVDTSAGNNEEIVSANLISIQNQYEKEEKIVEDDMEM